MKTNRKKESAPSHKKQSQEDDTVKPADDSVETVQEKDSDEAKPSAKDAGDSSSDQPPKDDRLLRLQADFDNYRKRMIREKGDIYRRANEDIMEELLPVLDHLELALVAAGNSEAHDSIAQGFKLVGDQLLSVLNKFGLTPIDTDGVAFDPNVHEAILHMPSPDVPENEIVSRTRAGYMLGGQLLRAAQVVVSSGAPENAEAQASPEDDA